MIGFQRAKKERSGCFQNGNNHSVGSLKDKTQKSQVEFYFLDAIISVGYRVNSIKVTKFRQWTTLVLREYHTVADSFGSHGIFPYSKQGSLAVMTSGGNMLPLFTNRLI